MGFVLGYDFKKVGMNKSLIPTIICYIIRRDNIRIGYKITWN